MKNIQESTTERKNQCWVKQQCSRTVAYSPTTLLLHSALIFSFSCTFLYIFQCRHSQVSVTQCQAQRRIASIKDQCRVTRLTRWFSQSHCQCHSHSVTVLSLTESWLIVIHDTDTHTHCQSQCHWVVSDSLIRVGLGANTNSTLTVS